MHSWRINMTWRNIDEIPQEVYDDDLLILYVADAHLAHDWKNKEDISLDVCTGEYDFKKHQWLLKDFHWNPASGIYYPIAWSNDYLPENIVYNGTKYIMT